MKMVPFPGVLIHGSLRLLLLGTASGLSLVPAPATAQSASASVRAFDIPAQPLASALQRFMQQSGVQPSYPSDLAEGRTSASVSGTMPPAEALSRLLAGTGLTYRFASPTAVTLAHAPHSGDDAIQLGTLRVEGASGSNTESSGGADSPYRTPGTSAHISRTQIDRVQPNGTGDILRNAAGVLSGSNHNGTQIDVNIRGMQGRNRVKVMVDGTQQESSLYRGYAGPDNRSYIDSELIGGINIEKGPGTGPYSAGAIGGTVNMRTLEARDILLPGNNYGVRMRGMIGDNRVGPRIGEALESGSSSLTSSRNWFGSAAAAIRKENYELVAAFSRRDQGNYFAGKKHGDLTYSFQFRPWLEAPVSTVTLPYSNYQPGDEVPNTSEKTSSALLKGLVRFGDGHSLELGFTHYDSTFGLVFPSQTFGRVTPAQYYLSNVESQRYSARYKWNPAESALINMSANLWRTVLDSNDIDYYSKVSTPVRSKAWGAEIWNASDIELSPGTLTLSYGGEYSSTRMRRDREQPADNIYRDTSGTRNLGGIFGRANYTADWLTVDAGLRYDHYRARGESVRVIFTYTGVGSFPYTMEYEYLPGRLSASAFSPSASIGVTPWDGLQLFAKYARGWRPPSLVETVGSGAAINIISNPDLKPERSSSWELGANVVRDGLFTAGDAFRMKFAYFDNDYTDYMVRQHYPNGGDAYYSFINIDGAKIKGLEVSGSYDAGIVFADYNLNYYTGVKFCFTSADNGVDGCVPYAFPGDWMGSYAPPEYSGLFSLGTRFFERKLTIGGRVNVFAKPALDFPPWAGVSAPTIWPASTIYDLFASYKFSDRFELDFSMENVTDRFYISPLASAKMPSPGRMSKLTLTARF